MISYQKIFLGSECNNACAECPARQEEKAHTLDDLMKQVDSADDPENLELCGGEPTLYEGLLSLIAHARSRGVRRIKLVTNGRRLCEWDLLTSLAGKGCRLFEVKIHGSSPQTHDAVTHVRGSFDQTVRGFQNLKNMLSSEKYVDAIYVAARVQVTRFNFEALTSTVALAVSLGVNRIILARTGIDLPISGAAQMVANALRVAALNGVWSVSEGFPPCLMKGSEMHLSELLQPALSNGKKPRGCTSCAYAHICTGPPEDYIRKRGPREFRPVSGSPYLEDVKRLVEIRSNLERGSAKSKRQRTKSRV
jgi:sulfatase maturation enzyme AslB (radical SAM superfamily)